MESAPTRRKFEIYLVGDDASASRYNEIYSSIIIFYFNFAFYGFKFLNAFSDKVENLSISTASFVFCDITQFIVCFGIDFNSKVFVIFVSHKISLQKSYFKYILRLFCGIML